MPISDGFSWNALVDGDSPQKQKIHFYLVSAALMTILLRPEYNNPFLLFIALNTFVNNKLGRNFKLAIKNPWVLLPIVYWLICLISVLYTDNQYYAHKELEKLAALAFFPFIISLGPKLKEIQILKIKWHYVVSICVLAIYSIIIAFFNMYDGGSFQFDWAMLSYENLASGIAVQPLYFSMFIAMALFFLFEFHRNYITSFAHILLIAFLFFYMIMLSTRMTTLAFFAIFAVYLAAISFRNKTYLVNAMTFTVFVLTAAAIIFLNPINKTRFSEALNPNSTVESDTYGGRSLRIEKWKCSFSVFADSPFTGVGIGDLQEELMNCYEERKIDSALFFKFNSHNQYLNTAVQIGIPGIIVLLLLIFGSMYRSIKEEDDLFLIFVSLFAMCIVSESMLARRWGIYFFTFFYSIFHLYRPRNFRPGLISFIRSKFKI